MKWTECYTKRNHFITQQLWVAPPNIPFHIPLVRQHVVENLIGWLKDRYGLVSLEKPKTLFTTFSDHASYHQTIWNAFFTTRKCQIPTWFLDRTINVNAALLGNNSLWVVNVWKIVYDSLNVRSCLLIPKVRSEDPFFLALSVWPNTPSSYGRIGTSGRGLPCSWLWMITVIPHRFRSWRVPKKVEDVFVVVSIDFTDATLLLSVICSVILHMVKRSLRKIRSRNCGGLSSCFFRCSCMTQCWGLPRGTSPADILIMSSTDLYMLHHERKLRTKSGWSKHDCLQEVCLLLRFNDVIRDQG